MSLVAGLLMIGTLVTAVPAWAHATLVSTNPPAKALIDKPPLRVRLTFSEKVNIRSGAIKVYAPGLSRVDRGDVRHINGHTVAVDMARAAPDGTYTVSWRVTSADSHPISGGFTFSVGHRSEKTGGVGGTGKESRPGIRSLLSTTHWFAYAGLATGPGLLLVLVTLWPAGRTDRRVRQILGGGFTALALATVVSYLLQGPYSTGRPLLAAVEPSVLAGTLGSTFGQTHLARLGLVLALGAFLPALLGGPKPGEVRPRRGLVAVAGLLTGGMLATWAMVGHASVGAQAPLAMTSTGLHLAAVATWGGGLVLLVFGLAPRGRAADLAAVLPRFSTVAFTAVVVLAATGSYQAWREIGHLAAFPSTGYGRLLMGKIAAFLALIALANLARRWVGRRYAGSWIHRLPVPTTVARANGLCVATDSSSANQPPDPGDVHVLRRGLAAEAALGLVVLALTAVLVQAVPGREAYAPTYSTTVPTGSGLIRVSVDPAETGQSSLHVFVRRDGRPRRVGHIAGSLSLPSRNIGPLPVEFRKIGPARASAHVPFPAAGRWSLDLEVHISQARVTTVRAYIPVN